MVSLSEHQKEINIATNKLTTMFLSFAKSEPQRSYKHGSNKKNKFERTTMRLFNAMQCNAMQCNAMQFSFQYFFHFMDELFSWNCTIDFKLILLDFAKDFAIFTIFTIWLQKYGWMDG